MPRVGHPAKEGLRLACLVDLAFFITPQSGSSSKRGIKTLHEKHYLLFPPPRVGHPAKEGLRLNDNFMFEKFKWSQSGSSSKRGIKTALKQEDKLKANTQSGSSSKRGIKTESSVALLSVTIADPEWVIQQKRD